MHHSKRARSPCVWLDEYSWEERMENPKRRKRDSHSSERENKSRRTNRHHRRFEGHYLETRSLNLRLGSREIRTRDQSCDMACEEDSQNGTCKDKDRDWHHYSKSSGRSGRSGRSRRSSRRHRDRRANRSHQSTSVWDLPPLVLLSCLCNKSKRMIYSGVLAKANTCVFVFLYLCVFHS